MVATPVSACSTVALDTSLVLFYIELGGGSFGYWNARGSALGRADFGRAAGSHLSTRFRQAGNYPEFTGAGGSGFRVSNAEHGRRNKVRD